MKKWMLMMAVTVAGLGFAKAETPAEMNTEPSLGAQAAPAWACKMQGDVSGFGLDIIVGFEHLKGTGVIRCTSANGQHATKNVALHLIGAGVGLGFSKVESLHLVTANIGVANGAEGMIGKYSIGASAGVTLINAGVDFDAAVSAAKTGGLSFDLGLKGKDAVGLHVKLHGMALEISEL